MKIRHAALIVASFLLASCATGYTLVASNSRVAIRNGLSVQPTQGWNQRGTQSEPNLAIWTMDGPLIDVLAFVPGLENNNSILKTPSGKEAMPVFKSTMGAIEVQELLEATLTRSSPSGASILVKGSNLRPAPFAGHPGFRFDYTFVNQQDDVERRGIAAGAVHNGRLYLIFFHGAKIHYFGKDAPEVEAIIASAQIS